MRLFDDDFSDLVTNSAYVLDSVVLRDVATLPIKNALGHVSVSNASSRCISGHHAWGLLSDNDAGTRLDVNASGGGEVVPDSVIILF